LTEFTTEFVDRRLGVNIGITLDDQHRNSFNFLVKHLRSNLAPFLGNPI